MRITLENIGKRFNREWIFRNINYEFCIGNKYAILGTNGSGKSTLLQIIAGAVSQTEGRLTLTLSGEQPPFPPTRLREALWRREEGGTQEMHTSYPPFGGVGGLSYAAPYMELLEEMTWKEAVTFHGKFKSFAHSLKGEDVISISGLDFSADKQLRNFSSGMKQRARLALAILSDTPLLLLDEPSTNLDTHAVKWYQNLIAEFAKEKLVITCSNYNREEYSFCNKELALSATNS